MSRLSDLLWRPWVQLRLRTKLTTVLVLAALVPMLVVATIAVGVVLGTLDRGLRDETERQREVGLNLILRAVERLGDDAARLAGAGDLSLAMLEGKSRVDALLAAQAPQLPSSLVQITDEKGAEVSRLEVGAQEVALPKGAVAKPNRYAGLSLDPASPLLAVGRAWGKQVTLDVVGDRLVVRAVAPIVDPSLALQGVVVISVPLDGDFADGIKGALGADMLLAARTAGHASSTFRDAAGARLPDVKVPAGILATVGEHGPEVTTQRIDGREYSIAWTALVDHEGVTVGVYGVAVDREDLTRARSAAFRSLAVGGALALGFALLLAALMSRRLGEPIARLHRGAVAVARGDLDHRLDVAGGDEIGELARAFSHMTSALKENQQRLAAHIREMVALHDAGRAMSSVIELDQVVRKVVDSVARTFEGQVTALWLRDAGGLTLAGSRGRRAGLRSTLVGADASETATRLQPLAAEVSETRGPFRLERGSDDTRLGQLAEDAGVTGSLVAAPLERKGQVIGVLVVGRMAEDRAFSEADANLLSTFADQAATAIENARLYAQVVGASEELEHKVRLRTAQLTEMNRELGKTLGDLRETQAQLILSERLAGLGLLVAGVAHEVNSPSAAIRGSVEAMTEVVNRLTRHLGELSALGLPETRRSALRAFVEERGRALAARRLPTGMAVRRAAKLTRARLEAAGIAHAVDHARALSEIGLGDGEHAEAEVDAIAAQLGDGPPELAAVAVGYLVEYVHLHRNVLTISNAIARIQRIVGALKTYSHLDQSATAVTSDVHEGIETTLVILDHALRGITVSRSYGALPEVPIYIDELNQVWTNLIQNAAQAVSAQQGDHAGHGTITIETAEEKRGDRGGVVVRILDNGPGVPEDVLPRIFEPFFTTKPKGEGTGLGLGIVRRIVEKHKGEVTCESIPGRTCFAVWLPVGAAAVEEGAA